MNRDKWVQFGAKCVRETDEALLIEVDLDEIWIPKSVVSDESDVQHNGDEGDLQVARWFADQEGLS